MKITTQDRLYKYNIYIYVCIYIYIYISNTETHSPNNCCRGKVICITYYECVSEAIVIQHAMRMHHIVFSGLSGSTTFFSIISQKARF